MKYSLAERIARTVDAYKRCQKTGNAEWEGRHHEAIEAFNKRLPSGSGIDSGSRIDTDATTENKVVIRTAFHHMNDAGMYDGWTEHSIIASASLVYGLSIDVTGRDRNDIKDYLGEVFHTALTEATDETA